jgi:threonine dehydrogenase-like Zn-dependent dehydrogenase
MRDVIVVIGPGQIGQAIARRIGVGKHVLLTDVRQENADAAAEVLGNAGYEASVATVDASSREAVHALVETATGLGDVTGLIHAAGVSPTQASPATILRVDLYGTALVLEEVGNVIRTLGSALASKNVDKARAADKEFTYSGDERAFCRQYVQRLVDEGISVGVVTNHNKFAYDEDHFGVVADLSAQTSGGQPVR